MAQKRAGRPLPMPPPEYDKPYDGPMIVAHVDAKMMAQLCPRTIIDRTSRLEVPVTLGCRHMVPVPNAAQQTTGYACLIVMAQDDIITGMGYRPIDIEIHERAHCLGWGADHPGARYPEAGD